MQLIVMIFGEGNDLSAGQMAARAAVIFLITLALIRLSGRRSFGQRTPFDAATTVLLGAVLSRAVVGASPFGATVAAATVLVVLHRVLGWLRVRWDGLDVWINGRERVVVSEGSPDVRALESSLLTRRDLEEAVRKKVGQADMSRVATATLERDGEVSLLMHP